MLILYIIILINIKIFVSSKGNLSALLFSRMSTIALIFTSILTYNILHLTSISWGIGIFNGLLQVSQISVFFEIFILLIGSFILVAWPLIKIDKASNINSNNGSTNPIQQSHQGSISYYLNLVKDKICEALYLKGSQPLQEGLISGENLYSYSKENIQDKEYSSTNLGTTSLPRNETESSILANYKYYINYATDYSIIVLFSTLGAILLVSSFNLVSLYLSIELQSYGLYILSAFYKDSKLATLAGLKYFLLGGLSSCFILLGSGLIYTITGLTKFDSIYSLLSVAVSNNLEISQGITLGLIFIFISFLFKIAAAPLHNWSPDVYNNTPTIVTIWLTIMPKISILILLLELYVQIDGASITLATDIILNKASTPLGSEGNNLLSLLSPLNNIEWMNTPIYKIQTIILICSLLSLCLGTIVGLAQTEIKRLLAYSTIAHIGFILLALAINTEQSVDSFLFYILQYSITNLNIFLIIIALGYIYNKFISNYNNVDKNSGLFLNKEVELGTPGTVTADWITKNRQINGNIEDQAGEWRLPDIKKISELKNLVNLNPLLCLSLAICLFSMAGKFICSMPSYY